MLKVKISWSLSNKRVLELVLQRSNNWKKINPYNGGSNPPKIPLYLSLRQHNKHFTKNITEALTELNSFSPFLFPNK